MSHDVTAVSLFSGIEGLGLGLHRAGLYDRTLAFCEYEDAPSRVLAHHYPDVPNLGDITQVDWDSISERVDVLHGGFPCQDISKAGKGAGIKEGTRSGLWFEYVRAIRDLRPGLVVVENVSALLGNGMGVVLGDLAEAGFDARWACVRASDVGAPHRRERTFIVAHAADSDRLGRLHRQAQVQPAEARVDALRDAPAGGHAPAADPDEDGLQAAAGGRGEVHEPREVQRPARRGAVDGWKAAGDSDHAGLEGRQAEPERAGEYPAGATSLVDWGEFGPAIRRWERVLGWPAPTPTDDGRLSPEFVEWHMGFPEGWTSILSRNDRLKALGNAVVPQVAELVGRWALETVDNQARTAA